MRVIVTGSRNHPDRAFVWAALDAKLAGAGSLFLLIGDCPTGADAHALAWAKQRHGEGKRVGWKEFPADWTRFGRAAGPIRNQAMIDAGADLCLAFPWPGARNAGTWDCARRAKAAGIRVEVCRPDAPGQDELIEAAEHHAFGG